MRADQSRVKNLLMDTITLLCKNGLDFRRKLKIEGVLGITLDDEDIFIVHIDEGLTAELSHLNRGGAVSTVTSTDEYPVDSEEVQIKFEPDVANEHSSVRDEYSAIQSYSSVTKSETGQMSDWHSERPLSRHKYEPDIGGMHQNKLRLPLRKKISHTPSSQMCTKINLNPSRAAFRDGLYVKYNSAHVLPPPNSFDVSLTSSASSRQCIPSNNVVGDTLAGNDTSLPVAVYSYNQLSEDENVLNSATHSKRSRKLEQLNLSSEAAYGINDRLNFDKRIRSDEMLAERDRIRQERCREMNRIRVRRWRTKVKARCRAVGETYIPSNARLTSKRSTISGVGMLQDTWNPKYLESLGMPDPEDLTNVEEYSCFSEQTLNDRGDGPS